MKNVCVAFDILADIVAPLPDHQYMHCHMIFDVEMDYFHKKNQLIARGHSRMPPATLTYASVVSHDLL